MNACCKVSSCPAAAAASRRQRRPCAAMPLYELLCLARPARRLRDGEWLQLGAAGQPGLAVRVEGGLEERGSRKIRFPPEFADAAALEPLLLRYGSVPLVHATGGLADITLPDGERAGQRVGTVLFPFTLGGRRPGVRLQPPTRGQHTTELLAALGYEDSQVADLVARRVVA